jgi:hypothetical protein
MGTTTTGRGVARILLIGAVLDLMWVGRNQRNVDYKLHGVAEEHGDPVVDKGQWNPDKYIVHRTLRHQPVCIVCKDEDKASVPTFKDV